MNVELNEAERRLAEYLAKSRHKAARSGGVSNSRVGPQSDEQTDLEGVGSELAVCKLLNVYPDFEVGVYADYDVLDRQGRGIDVKSTTYETGRLIGATWKKSKAADFYILMVGRFPRYRCAGVLSGDELFRDENLTDLTHGPAYAVEQSKLEDVREWGHLF